MSNKKSLLSRLRTNGVLKALAFYGLLAVAIDRLTLPASYYFAYGNRIKNEAIQEKMETEKYCFDYQGSSGETALKYLKLAHAITTKYMDIGNPGVIDNFFDSKLLENKIGDCSEFSRFTYSNFIYLVNSVKKTDLLSQVRLAIGTVSSKGGGEGHMWVEILKGGSWVPYEALAKDLLPQTTINPEKIDSLIPNSWVLKDTKHVQYQAMATHQVNESGKIDRMINLGEILTADGAFKIAYNNFAH